MTAQFKADLSLTILGSACWAAVGAVARPSMLSTLDRNPLVEIRVRVLMCQPSQPTSPTEPLPELAVEIMVERGRSEAELHEADMCQQIVPNLVVYHKKQLVRKVIE